MGYEMHGFIAKTEAIMPIASNYQAAEIIQLSQGVGLIIMTDELYDEINDFADSESLFTYLSPTIETKVLALQPLAVLGYIEAEYFGGQGIQHCVLWEGGKRVMMEEGHRVINTLLKRLGVIAHSGLDEFETIDLARYRRREDWK